MDNQTATLDEALAIVQRLTPLDKVRLLERVASTLERDLTTNPTAPLQTFKGILAHLGPGPTDEDIAEVRREMMRNFPREDF